MTTPNEILKGVFVVYRYAFAPLIDVGEDDDDDMTLSDAFRKSFIVLSIVSLSVKTLYVEMALLSEETLLSDYFYSSTK